MGTQWYIEVIGTPVSQDFWEEIERETQRFEEQFSRFIPESEVNSWKQCTQPQTSTVSPVLAELLEFAQTCKSLTNGAFDPAVGTLLEQAGYDATYTFQNQPNVENWQPPYWHISHRQLSVREPLVFDIGGFGKGYWIDQLSHRLQAAGYPFHLIDGGGDMFATTKLQGQAWKIVVPVPGNRERALDVVALKNQGLAISDTLQRRWGHTNNEWHHIVDPLQAQPQNNWISAAVLSDSAMVADALTTCLMVSPPTQWGILQQAFEHEYLLTNAAQIYKSSGWPGLL